MGTRENGAIGFEARRGGALLGKSSYRYDAFNRRVASSADLDGDGNDDVVTYHVYGGQAAWQLLAEYDGADDAANLLRSYVYGLYIDEVLSMRDHASDDDYFYHQDDLFSVYALTDADGVVVERYDYGDYGQVSIMEANGTPRAESAYGNRHAFTGRFLMPELTLDDGSQILEYRHRYMHTASGRFVQRDPLGYVDGMGLYAYTISNPLNVTDPSGMQVEDWTLWPSCTSKPNAKQTCTSVDVAQCMAFSAANPQPPGTGGCNKYKPSDTYSCSNARCFCECAGDNPWSNFVRECLQCMYSRGCGGHNSHANCYAAATRAHGSPPTILLAACSIKCWRYQQTHFPESACGATIRSIIDVITNPPVGPIMVGTIP